MKIVQECGQKWYRWSSWKVTTKNGLWRKLNHRGFAIGPIMFFFEEKFHPPETFGAPHESHVMVPVFPADKARAEMECLVCNSCTCHSQSYLNKVCLAD